ncbi:D-alanyl-D-alanine carboxypeptidase precursor (plasmid) [Roseivivax sp. THAF40]|uniref:serine hydrolase domain-containing protein n=1 Tax=unclassified Roseivivax TaxID=2639302 RepID=UPI0012681C77|nr:MULTISPECIES: serine hydrolase domain-containing protein [unclassified Roseivivax]QFS84923.1 D-alanyl-D-alanine carboxypeptidase precursor [Roseivivax sp. THAF197b]QFT48624.1 D-alanyl-D-alanine carboxypeptidase precursor [Roseivivax sp. THAF40]
MSVTGPVFTHRIFVSDDAHQTGGTEVFPYWSFTKTVIAICALRMAQERRLDLDRHVTGYDFTLRQLLNHTSGLPDYFTVPDYREAVARNEQPWTAEHLREITMAQGRLFAPGQGWAYSNLGYMLARDLIEDVAERPFADLVKHIICDPLGLDSIELAVTRRDFERAHWTVTKGYHPGWVYHGCLVGSAADAARLLHALFRGKLLNASVFGEMLVQRPLGGAIEGRPWTECGYALGLMSGRCGDVGRAIGHSGAGPFCVNAVYHFPDLPRPVTVASFTDGADEGVAEFAAVSEARRG